MLKVPSPTFFSYRCDKLFGLGPCTKSVLVIFRLQHDILKINCTASKLLVSPHALTMSLLYQSAARSCVHSLRSSSSLRISAAGIVRRRDTETRRWASTETAASGNPKISGIVDQISQLTLLETADLVASLKVCYIVFSLLPPGRHQAPKPSSIPEHQTLLTPTLQTRLNIPDMAMGSFSSGGPAPTAPAAAVEEEEAAPVQQEKTLFNLKLMSFEAGSKPKIIKQIKSMLGLSLVDSKKFVESAPKLMKEAVPKEEAEKIVEVIKGLGGVVVME